MLVSVALTACGPHQNTLTNTSNAGFPSSINGQTASGGSLTSLNFLAGTYTGVVYKQQLDGSWPGQNFTLTVSFPANQRAAQMVLSSEGDVFGQFQIVAPLQLAAASYGGYVSFASNILTDTALFNGSMALLLSLRTDGTIVDPAQSGLYAYDCVVPEGLTCSTRVDDTVFVLNGKH